LIANGVKMKLEIFLVLMSCCLFLASSRGIDNNDNDNEDSIDEGNDTEEFDDEEAFGDDDDWFVDDDELKAKDEENDMNKKESEILNKARKSQWGKQENPKQSVQATDRLMKELRDVYRSKMYKNNEYSVELVDESLYDWNVVLRTIDPDSALYKDLQILKEKEGKDGILFNIKFGANYPFEAPFVRVVYPVIRDGHIFGGGAVCMELLNPKGWSSVYTVETIITQLGATIVEGNGRIAFGARDQGAAAAKRGYEMLDSHHERNGWGKQEKF